MMRRLAALEPRRVATYVLLAGLIVWFLSIHPRGPSPDVLATWSDQGAALAMVAAGQTLIVMTGGIDLSIGPTMALADCVASTLLEGTPLQLALGILAVLATGALCGAVNGLVVVVGRIQPIVATLATGAIYTGLALILRPIPGGSVDDRLADLVTGPIGTTIPASLVFVLGALALVWGPLQRTMIGRTIVAVGSAGNAAYMSGLPIRVATVVAYATGGLFAALGGLFLSFQTLSGDPSIGTAYTLNAVAAVVLGGTSLAGGSGTVLGSVAGAYILRTLGSLVFFTGLGPMAQPLFEGIVLAVAVAAGATRLIGIRNRLEVIR